MAGVEKARAGDPPGYSGAVGLEVVASVYIFTAHIGMSRNFTRPITRFLSQVH